MKKLLRGYRKLINSFCVLLCLLPQVLFASNSARFLIYHRVGEGRYPTTSITEAQFSAQMAYLAKQHYAVFPDTEIVYRLKHHLTLPQHTVGISFDDAYRSVYTVAWPILKRYHFPFTVFVATEPVDKHYGDMMTWAQIRILSRKGVTIGNHSASHSYLEQLTPNDIKQQIGSAQETLIRETGKIPTLFAYPYGEYSRATQKVVQAFGFKAAFSQTSGVAYDGSDFYALPRFAFNERYGTLKRFKFITQLEPLRINKIAPQNVMLTGSPSTFYFKLADKTIVTSSLRCYYQNQALPLTIDKNLSVMVTFDLPFSKGRNKINCTAQNKQRNWHWQGFLFIYI